MDIATLETDIFDVLSEEIFEIDPVSELEVSKNQDSTAPDAITDLNEHV